MYYHVWFSTKYRKPLLTGELNIFVKETVGECIIRHRYEVFEFNTDKDHMHLLVAAEDKAKLSAIIRTIKAVSAKEVFSPRFRVGNVLNDAPCGSMGKRHLWARRYDYKMIPVRVLGEVREYIRRQSKCA